jgi:superfamily II DNA or RNA helicase
MKSIISIHIDNSVCHISGLDRELYSVLRQYLSYETKSDKYRAGRGFYTKKKYLIDKHGKFPTGLLYLVNEALETVGIKPSWYDSRKKPKGVIGAFLPKRVVIPYPDQINAAKAALDASRGIIVAPTGSGKSVIASLIVQSLRVPTLIVVPSVELRNQLNKTLSEIFPFDTVDKLEEFPQIAVENVDALDPKVPLPEIYQCVIIDEFHHGAAKTYQDLNENCWNKVYYKFGLTATPFRSDDNERLLLESILSQVIYKIEYQTAIGSGYIRPLQGYVETLPKIPGISNLKTWHDVYNRQIVNNEYRNTRIVKIIHGLIEDRRSVLTLVKTIEHGEILKKMCTFDVPFVNGNTIDNMQIIKDFSDGIIPALIATSVVGEGIDTKACEFVILAGGSGKSKVSIMQNCGRALRNFQNKDYGKVITFFDPSHKWLIDHHKKFEKVLREEYNIELIEI